MKKTLIAFLLVGITYFLIGAVGTKALAIPAEAIRFRVVPNSNSIYDQEIKTKVRDVLQEELYQLLKNTKGVDEAREMIRDHLDDFDKKVALVLEKEKYDLSYNIRFGYNHFPEKVYKGTTYKEGMYESVLVTIGKGEGDNWWCVLFPPLCLIEAEESTKVEYTSFVKELIDRYL